MNVQKWTMPKSGLSSENQELWNAIMTYAGHSVGIPESVASFCFMPIDSPPVEQMFISITDKKNMAAWLSIDVFPFLSLLNVDLNVAQINELDPSVRDCLNEGMVNTIISVFPADIVHNAAVSLSVSVDDISEDNEQSEIQWFSIALDGACPEPIFFTLGMNRDKICLRLKNLDMVRHPVWHNLKSQLTQSVSRVLGVSELDAKNVKSLRAGDILLMQSVLAADQNFLVNDFLYRFERVEEGWHCASVQPASTFLRSSKSIEKGALTMKPDETGLEDNHPVEIDETVNPLTDEHDEQTETAAAINFEPAELKMRLSFDLGETHVVLSEIESWQTGAIVPLITELTQDNLKVIVRANGQAIAEGDLIKIDDRTAVRLSKMFIRD